jgi:hypothetical protein
VRSILSAATFQKAPFREPTLLRRIIFSDLMSELGHERRIRANAPAAG